MLTKILNEYARKRHAREAKKFDTPIRASTVGGSEIGQCIRKVFFSKTVDRDFDHVEAWGASRRGKTYETHFWVPALRAHYGDNVLYIGGEQRQLVAGKLSATPDGLLINQPRDTLAELYVPDIGKSGEIVIECKTLDPRIKLSEAREENVFQTQVQLGLFRETTKHKPDYAVISYVNASFFDDITEFAIEFDPAIYARAKQRADQIMRANAADELPPEGWIAGGKECGYCAFKRACGIIRMAVPDAGEGKRPDRQLIAEMTDLARAEREWFTKAGSAEAEQRKMQHEIKEKMKANGLRRIKDGDRLNITWSTVKGRPAYDWPAIRLALSNAGIDTSQFETVGEPSDRLVIQVSKPAEETKRGQTILKRTGRK